MRMCLPTPIRLLGHAAIVVTAFAIGLGRWQGKTEETRTPAFPRYLGIRKYHVLRDDRRTPALDLESGDIKHFSIPSTDSLEGATCSPWRDALGRFHVVGTWKSLAPGGWDSRPKFGLARFAVPGGEALDRIEFETSVADPPCWAPDHSGQVLFAGGDWRIRSVRFDSNQPESFRKKASPRIHKLFWKPTTPREHQFVTSHMTWPNDERFSRIVVVSAVDNSTIAHLIGHKVIDLPIPRHRLWWVRLDGSRESIEAVGRLWPADPSADELYEDRHPNVGRAADGGLVLAFIRRNALTRKARLALVPLEFSEETRTPQADPARLVECGEPCVSSPPGFSPGGEWVYAFEKTDALPARIARHDVRSVMGQSRPTAQPLQSKQSLASTE
ncbi:hypothetical protein [Singulisphaera sp. PoT]|uniref:hypothetical protein n=1 Tax=Singulisphaera sp. PoT TaxID=3411797 RepID=UPI003BF51EA7